ncbi:MAG: hypothetical protein GY754_30075 [bacterium]|nr:hypothetical protein [bacterium]
MKNIHLKILLEFLKFIVLFVILLIAVYFIADSVSDFRMFLFPFILLSVLYIVIAYKRELPGSVKANKHNLCFTEKDIPDKSKKRKVTFKWEDIDKISLRVAEADFPDEWFGFYMECDWLFHLNNGAIIEIDNTYMTWYTKKKISGFLSGFNVESASRFIKSKTEGELVIWHK